MPKESKQPVVVPMDVRKLKRGPETNLPTVSKAKLRKMIEKAVVLF